MISSKILCFIPAKRASTRLREKNILKINGIELVGHVLNSAKGSNLFKDIVVSSEDEEILEIGKKYGATFTSKRPPHLAIDPFGVADVLLHFLESNNDFLDYQVVCISLPTSPLVIPDDFISCFNFFKQSGFDCVWSVTENEHSAYRSITVSEQGDMQYLFPDHFHKKSQELEKTYRINGAVCFIKIQALLKYRDYIVPNTGGYIMPRSRSVDVDTAEDLQFAEFLMNKIN